MDWNEDNKKDLLVGEWDGHIRIYLNTGSDAAPVFSGYTYLQVGGADFWPSSYSNPWVVDWNEDGKKDMIVGYGDQFWPYENVAVYLLINSGTNAAPVFDTYSKVQDASGDMDFDNNPCPTVVDWNRDGKKDIIVGDDWGSIYYHENVGTNAAPLFDEMERMKLGDTWIRVGDGYSRPMPVDWNNDGVMDLLSGCSVPVLSGYVYFYEGFDGLHCDPDTLPTGTGGTVDFELRAGTYSDGETYILLGSMSGTSPGIPLKGGHATLPLQWDFFTSFVLGLKNTIVFKDFYGTIDGSGLATAQLNSPAWPPGYVGYPIYFAFCTIYPFTFASNYVTVTTAP